MRGGVRVRSVDLLDFERGGVRVKGGPVIKWGGGTFNTPTCVTVVRACCKKNDIVSLQNVRLEES